MDESYCRPKCRRSIHDAIDATKTITKTAASSSPKIKSKLYSPTFLKYGFTYIGNIDCPKPKCLICYQVFTNSQMTPDYLESHCDLKHPEYKNKPKEFFEKQLGKLEKAQIKTRRSLISNMSVVTPAEEQSTKQAARSNIKPIVRSTSSSTLRRTSTRPTATHDWSMEVDSQAQTTRENMLASSPSIKQQMPSASKRKSIIARNYSSEFLKFGFTYIGDEDAKPKPKCLLCYEILPNSSMHETALQAHLETKHAEYAGKSIEFFEKQLEKLEKAQQKSRRLSFGNDTFTSPAVINTVAPAITPKKSYARQYFDGFLQYGFTYTGDDEDQPKPKCLLCYEILPNASMHDAALRYHFETKHSEFADHPIDFFHKQLDKHEKNQMANLRRSSMQSPRIVQQVSPTYKQSWHVEYTDTTVSRTSMTVTKPPPTRKSINRQYSDEFLKIGFTSIGDDAKPKPKCLLCYEILPNSSMHEAALHAHFTTKHVDYVDKPIEFFKKQLNKFLKTKNRLGQRK